MKYTAQNILRLSFFIVAILTASNAVSQSGPGVVPFNSSRWEKKAKEIVEEEYRGKKSLRVINGSVTLSDAYFKNGVIEFDIALEHARYFPGIAFRMQDSANTELYYVRPHQSGNPDAMQYYHVYHGGDSWQLHYGGGFTNAHALPFEGWLHIRILVRDSMAEVYFDQEPKPVLFISKLKQPAIAGIISLQNYSDVPVHFADFSFLRTDTVVLLSKPKPAPVLPAGTLTTWQVSNSFDESWLKEKILLYPKGTRPAMHWQTLTTDDRGIADFSILSGLTKDANTVFARTIVWSDKDEIRKFSFGFSDRARVFCNGRLLYTGNDGYMSRDYRFLGTIGLYDAVYLDFKKGINEIWVAVSEDFGGWGFQARLE